MYNFSDQFPLILPLVLHPRLAVPGPHKFIILIHQKTSDGWLSIRWWPVQWSDLKGSHQHSVIISGRYTSWRGRIVLEYDKHQFVSSYGSHSNQQSTRPLVSTESLSNCTWPRMEMRSSSDTVLPSLIQLSIIVADSSQWLSSARVCQVRCKTWLIH